MTALLLRPRWPFLVAVLTTGLALVLSHPAIPLGGAYEEPQGLLEAEPAAILGRLGSDQFLSFFYFQLLSETSEQLILLLMDWFPFKGEAEL